MKRLLVATLALSSMGMFSLVARAADKADDASESHFTGVLIDNNCGEKQKDEKSAAKHPISCAKKESCADSGYQLIIGDKHYKFDDKGNEQAKTYLEKAKSTHVTVEGKKEGDDKIAVTSIKAAKKGTGDQKKEDDQKESK